MQGKNIAPSLKPTLKFNVMKRRIQIFYLLSAVFILTVMSCQKEPVYPLDEPTIDSNKIITVEQNGVGIEFYLLNDNGEPDTVFNEGENFKFHLAIINNVEPDSSMFIVSEFLKNPNLFKVFRSAYDTVGKPVELHGWFKKGDPLNEILQGEKWVM